MINPYGTMYLRPGNFWKQFTVKRLKVRMVGGYSVEEYVIQISASPECYLKQQQSRLKW